MDPARVVERHSRLHKTPAPRRSAVHPNPSRAAPPPARTRVPRQPNRGPSATPTRTPSATPTPIHRRANRRTRFCATWRSRQSGCFLVSAFEQGTTCGCAIILPVEHPCIGLRSNISPSKTDFTMHRLHVKSLSGDLHDALADRYRVVARTFIRHCDRIGRTNCDTSVQRGTEKVQ